MPRSSFDSLLKEVKEMKNEHLLYISILLAITATLYLISRIRISYSIPNVTSKSASPGNLKNFSYYPVGKGSFGAVYKCTYNGKPAALKLFHPEIPSALIKHESQQLSRLKSHQNIVSFYGNLIVKRSKIYSPNRIAGFFYNPEPLKDSIGLMFEWASNGSLDNYLQKHRLRWSKKFEISKQIVAGLRYIHENNIVHQDLKSANILIDEKGTAKIADFGIARFKRFKVTFNDKTVVSSKANFGQGGTPQYMAPELVRADMSGKEITCSSSLDIFSLGILLWEIATNRLPKRTHNEMVNGEFSEKHQAVFFKNPIDKCLQFEQSTRPSASEVQTLLKEEEDSLKREESFPHRTLAHF